MRAVVLQSEILRVAQQLLPQLVSVRNVHHELHDPHSCHQQAAPSQLQHQTVLLFVVFVSLLVDL